MNAAGLSDLGLVRYNNEDSLYISEEPIGNLPNLFIVADGMGGHKSGEVASNKSIEYFLEFCVNEPIDGEELLDYIIGAVKNSNNRVHALSLSQAKYEGMGTTFTACIYDERKIYAVHVGDSRLYIVKNSEIKQITADHTFVNEMVKMGQLTADEAGRHPNRNVLTRALGSQYDVLIDGYIYEFSGDEKVLLCSDGLTGTVPEGEILDIIMSNSDNNESITENLISAANRNGGIDNCTAIVFDMRRC